MDPVLQKASVAVPGKGVIDAYLVEAGEERMRRGQAFSAYLDEWNADAGGVNEAELAATASEWPDLS